MQYELFYLVGQRQEGTLDEIRKSVNEMLTAEGAKLLEPELTEKRKLAYEIKHQNKGTYVTRRFELEDIDFWADEKNGEREFGIAAINNKLNLTNDVLRFLIVKTDDLPDLGAKDRRKAQEMKTQRPETGRPQQRTERRDTPRPYVKPIARVATPAPVVAKVAEIKEVVAEIKPAIKPTTAEETQATAVAKEVAKEIKKETSKDIDKQLDELLNI
ncbi:MAG: 30S ribosomal protein S6 [Candidatus Moraniibacteriota bacterium]